MGAAAERAKELRTKLAKAEKDAKAERDAERAAERERQRAKDIADTDAFREENYELVAGPHSHYVTVNEYDGRFEVGIAEWTTHQTSTTLTREEAIAFAEGILKLVK